MNEETLFHSLGREELHPWRGTPGAIGLVGLLGDDQPGYNRMSLLNHGQPTCPPNSPNVLHNWNALHSGGPTRPSGTVTVPSPRSTRHLQFRATPVDISRQLRHDVQRTPIADAPRARNSCRAEDHQKPSHLKVCHNLDALKQHAVRHRQLRQLVFHEGNTTKRSAQQLTPC